MEVHYHVWIWVGERVLSIYHLFFFLSINEVFWPQKRLLQFQEVQKQILLDKKEQHAEDRGVVTARTLNKQQ